MSQRGISVQEVDRDRYSRVALLNMGEKKLKFPNFFPRIKNAEELDSFIHINTLFPQDHIGAYNVRLSDQPNEVFSNKAILNQMTIDMEHYAHDSIRSFYDKTIMMIDPVPEYLFYEGGEENNKLCKQIKFLSLRKRKLDVVLKYLENRIYMKNKMPYEKFGGWKNSEYKKFWYKLDRNQEEMSKFIGETHDIEIGYDSDVLMPFVPIILNEGMLDISTRINKISNAIAVRDSATYLILNISTLKNDLIMKKLINFLENDPTKITIIKIKYMDLYKSGYMVQRENYRELMKTMSNITEDEKEKFYVLLDGGIQCFPSAAVGFDMVSTSMTGLDGDGAFGTTPYGRWFYPKRLWSIPHKKAIDMFEKNKGSPPCPCPACAEIAQIGPRNVKSNKWNDLRREHYLHSMDYLIRMVHIFRH